MPLFQGKDGDGARFPVVNRRVDPTEAGLYVLCQDILTIVDYPEAPNIGYVRLKERPIVTHGGVGAVVKNNQSGDTYIGTTTWPPEPMEFYVSPYLGRMYFHDSAVGVQASISYTGLGSIIDATDINYLNDILQVYAKPVTPVTVPANSSKVLEGFIAMVNFRENNGAFDQNLGGVTVAITELTDPTLVQTVYTNTESADVVVYSQLCKYHPSDGA